MIENKIKGVYQRLILTNKLLDFSQNSKNSKDSKYSHDYLNSQRENQNGLENYDNYLDIIEKSYNEVQTKMRILESKINELQKEINEKDKINEFFKKSYEELLLTKSQVLSENDLKLEELCKKNDTRQQLSK